MKLEIALKSKSCPFKELFSPKIPFSSLFFFKSILLQTFHSTRYASHGTSRAGFILGPGSLERNEAESTAHPAVERYDTNSASCRQSAAAARVEAFALSSSACQFCLHRPRHADHARDHARDGRWGDLCFGSATILTEERADSLRGRFHDIMPCHEL